MPLGVEIIADMVTDDMVIPGPLEKDWIDHLSAKVDATKGDGSTMNAEVRQSLVVFLALWTRVIRGLEQSSFLTEKETSKAARAVYGTSTDSGYYIEALAVVQALLMRKRKDLVKSRCVNGVLP